MNKQRKQTDGSSRLTASGAQSPSSPSSPHVITLRRGDGVVIRYEYPAGFLRAGKHRPIQP